MQQLNLFTNTRPQRITPKRNLRKNNRLNQATGVGWDLFTTQEPEEEKEMALFFLDIRNFTPFIQKHQPAEVIHIIRKLFSMFRTIIRINHGEIIETSGDGFYAAFGSGRGVTEAVNNAVRAGISILKNLEMLNEHSFEKSFQQKINVGIGVHVGKVATGNIHLGSKDHVIVMGYAVNIASRLQNATKELNNNFIVSDAVFNLLENPPVENLTTIVNLKGVTGPCHLHLIGKPYTVSCKEKAICKNGTRDGHV